MFLKFLKFRKDSNHSLKLEKWHSLGNDFLISTENVKKEEIIKLSDRKFGIGCDQFIIFNPETFEILFFNADGSECETCGNALKCIVYKIYLERNLTSFVLKTKNGEVNVCKKDGSFLICIGTSVEASEYKNPFLHINYDPISKKDITYDFLSLLKNQDSSFYLVNLANPHLVCFLNLDKQDILLKKKLFDTFLSSKTVGEIINFLGSRIQKDFLKTSGINLSFALPENSSSLFIRTFERGVGETLSCGSAACASVFSGIMAGFFQKNSKVKVFSPGSEKISDTKNNFTEVFTDEVGKIWISGTGTKVAHIIIN